MSKIIFYNENGRYVGRFGQSMLFAMNNISPTSTVQNLLNQATAQTKQQTQAQQATVKAVDADGDQDGDTAGQDTGATSAAGGKSGRLDVKA